MWVPFLRPFPGNEAHNFFLLGAQNGGFGARAKQSMLKKFMCFFGPLRLLSHPAFGARKGGGFLTRYATTLNPKAGLGLQR